MGIAERKEREKKRRWKEIVDAAERVFFSKGIELATMDEIAEEAELSKGTLYLYFKNKQELCFAVNYRGLRILHEMFRKGAGRYQTGLEKVYGIGMAYYAFYQKYPDYFRFLVYYESHEMDIGDPESVAAMCAEQGNRVMSVLIDALHLGIDDGSIRPGIDPVKTSLTLWGFSSGLIQLISLKGDHLAMMGVKEKDLVQDAYQKLRFSLETK